CASAVSGSWLYWYFYVW
nr:immunoglobulin heavy chain junction region [Macaca mulatta]MOW77225.1 immunoglobulin heavy chain junction region [Macaca mulatta]MOW77462.1 immunoglobulin heavy chain junction region [Macaca mulatta]MOW79407.1 immunoglobulin heavy chain junction region [Macaca mulatta]MOW80012.1 immunoglobulin heavy chain junction region [Macaca mulatta]